MAKYHDMGIADVGFTADTDLTARQYHFVTPASTQGNVKLSTGASNPTVLGVLQNSPSAGQEARVRIVGFSKMVGENGACNLTVGTFVTSGSDGQAESMTPSGCPAVARWMGPTYATAGSIVGEVLLFGFSACISASN